MESQIDQSFALSEAGWLQSGAFADDIDPLPPPSFQAEPGSVRPTKCCLSCHQLGFLRHIPRSTQNPNQEGFPVTIKNKREISFHERAVLQALQRGTATGHRSILNLRRAPDYCTCHHSRTKHFNETFVAKLGPWHPPTSGLGGLKTPKRGRV